MGGTAEYKRALRRGRKAKGLCIECDNKPVAGKTLCKHHAASRNADIARLKKRRKAKGLCPNCGRPTDSGRVVCTNCQMHNTASAGLLRSL